MDARSIIAKVRDGSTPSSDELTWFAHGLASEAVTDAQAAAFAMAVCLNGLGDEGKVALTEAMRDSGRVLTWDLPGPAVDKHSTGGIGDAVSLVLAPLLAAVGAFVPMISGRGLGHTGGTLDKLEAIPGVSTEVRVDAFRKMVRTNGAAIVAATGDLAPADRRLYAIRDITGTVESVDLITASILSKKLAAGLDALVLDVKVGSGAFMETANDATALAKALVETANGAGCKTAALISDMSQPLAPAAGNALEVAVSLDVLTGTGLNDPTYARFIEVTLDLASELLAISGQLGLADRDKLLGALATGTAAERFGAMMVDLGAAPDFLENWKEHLPKAPVQMSATARETGFIRQIKTRSLGEAVVHLGGGRLKGGDPIDPSVGLSGIAAIGAHVDKGDTLAVIHAADAAAAEKAIATLEEAFALGDQPVDPTPLVQGRIN
ncbi:MAG: thymidine phosphorylase [Pseudomonadota bacterium]